MTLFRLIALALLVWIGWHLLKSHLAKSARRPEQAPGSSRMVKCRECDVHLPEAEAIHDADAHFCSKAHLLSWRQRS